MSDGWMKHQDATERPTYVLTASEADVYDHGSDDAVEGMFARLTERLGVFPLRGDELTIKHPDGFVVRTYEQ